MTSVEITIPADPTSAEREAILAPLLRYNEEHGGPARNEPVAILLRDPATQEILGGLWGRISFRWLFVELLCIPAPLRKQGLGSQLLARAEEIARGKGCVGIWLDTFGFQAPDFYPRMGYEVFGTIEDHPVGGRRFCLQKRFVAPTA